MNRLILALLAVPALSCAQSLDGYWTNATSVPFERPASVNGREFYTDEELKANAEKAKKPVDIASLAGTDIHYDFVEYGLDPSQSKMNIGRRTSIVFDPPDGKMPPMNAAGRARAAARAEARKAVGQFDGPETRPLGERCIIWPGEGPPMLPEAYNSNIQIHSGPGYVAILQEMIHDVRIVPIDGPPHPGPNVRSYMGDSRGHWDGNTLVVDTTNFNGRSPFRGSSDQLHVIERFTRMNDSALQYQFTIEDPATWDRPWSGELIMTKAEGPIFEYACHEGNYGMANTLRGARAAEKEQAK